MAAAGETAASEANDPSASAETKPKRKPVAGEKKMQALKKEVRETLGKFEADDWAQVKDKGLEGLIRRVDGQRTKFLSGQKLDMADTMSEMHIPLSKAHAFLMQYRRGYAKNHTDANLKELLSPIAEFKDEMVKCDLAPHPSILLLEAPGLSWGHLP